MSALWRTSLSSFLSGFGLASGLAMYGLKSDVRESNRVLSEQ